MLSQFCRVCQGNYAGYIENVWQPPAVKSAFLSRTLSLSALTIGQKMVILESRTLPSQESIMSDEKLKALRQSHALHPHPERVRDPLFTSGSPIGADFRKKGGEKRTTSLFCEKVHLWNETSFLRRNDVIFRS